MNLVFVAAFAALGVSFPGTCPGKDGLLFGRRDNRQSPFSPRAPLSEKTGDNVLTLQNVHSPKANIIVFRNDGGNIVLPLTEHEFLRLFFRFPLLLIVSECFARCAGQYVFCRLQVSNFSLTQLSFGYIAQKTILIFSVMNKRFYLLKVASSIIIIR